MIRKIKGMPLKRTFLLSRSAIDVEKRTVEISFSSETEEVQRWFGIEVLDHSPGACDLSRLNNSGPLLFNHDMDTQLGVIEEAQIDSIHRKGQAIVRFGNGMMATEKFQDVQDGVLTKVSCMYDPIEMRLEKTGSSGQPDIYRVTKWKPYEISMVTVPADDAVGVGRTAQTREIEITISDDETEENPQEDDEMENCTKCATKLSADGPCPVCAERAKSAAAITAAQESQKNTAEDIRAIAKKFGMADLALEFISAGRSVQEFQAAVLEKRFDAKPAKPIDIGLSGQEERQYSMVRAINYAAFGGERCLEAEVHDEISKKLGRQSKGIFVPLSLRAPLTAGSAGAGGDTVPTQILPLIELLRNKMMVRQMGATVMSGLTGNVAFPRQTGTTTLYWVGESPVSDVTETEASFEQLILTPKTAQATTAFSRQLLQQSSIDVEGFVRNDLMMVNALGLDLSAIHGTGQNSQPTGILATSNIGAVVGGTDGALPTWAHIVALESKIAAANADMGSLGYLTNPKVRGILKTTQKFPTYGAPVWDVAPGSNGFGEINGYKAGATNQVSSTLTKGSATSICSAIIFGNWADLLIGEFGVMEVLVDPLSLKKKGLIEVTTFIMVDQGVRHAGSFAAMKDALTTGQ